MAEYDNTNTGIMFQNDKGGNEKRPDWKGSLDIDGVAYWISGWEKETSKGIGISLKVEMKNGEQPNTKGIAHRMNPPARQQQPQQQPSRDNGRASFRQNTPPAGAPMSDAEIPF